MIRRVGNDRADRTKNPQERVLHQTQVEMRAELDMQDEKNKTTWALAGAVGTAVMASLCCILPVIAVGLGLTGFAASRFFQAGRPYLLVATAALMGFGVYRAYHSRHQACEPGGACERMPLCRWNRLILWLASVLVIVLAAFPYYSGRVVRAISRDRQRVANVS